MKGFEILIKAAEVIYEKSKEVTILVAGGVYPETDVMHKKWISISPPNMYYLGLLPHDELSSYYASVDVCVIPSLWEDPCPLVVFESLSSGTPVIASKIGGIPELVKNGVDGFLIQSGSVKELSERIMWCKENDRKLKKLSSNARKSAEKRDWKQVSLELEGIYNNLLARRITSVPMIE